ncbi:MAG TPA: hypothetical protein VMU80_12550 [Bryobacteraceae bacterium]|nr:hypothetical protein [Bryobacteraceae bacterium]
MLAHVLFFVAALAVRQDQTPLHSGCESDDSVVATLPAGTPVEVRFRLSDGSDCYKIAATVEGKQVLGYVPASALTGVESFEKETSSAGSVGAAAQALEPAVAVSKDVIARLGDPTLDHAVQLMTTNQFAEALGLLETIAQRRPHDANILTLAGLAAYRADQLKLALDYLQQAQDIAPNPALADAYKRIKREADADHSDGKLIGVHIALRYEDQGLPADTARAILTTLDAEYDNVSAQLGCSPGERIVAIVQSRESYLRSTGAAEWSGGLYDGRIHIAWWEGVNVGPEIHRALTHELVHACLTSMPSGGTPWPAWLQEGLAQKLSGDTLPASERDQLRQLTANHQIPRLENLRQDWSRLSTANARAAYALALAAADALYDNYAAYGIRNILNNPQTLPRITADLDSKLGF